jgi:hypothetical protein
LAIVTPFLTYHEYSLFLPESVILAASAILFGSAVGLVCWLRPQTLAPALLTLALCFYVFCRPELFGLLSPAVRRLGDISGNIGFAAGVFGVALFIVLGTIAWTLRRHFSTIVTVVFGTMVASTLLLSAHGGEPIEQGALPSALNHLPPVIHIILDEHIGLAGLPGDIEGGAEAARAIETTFADFALYPRAYSRFAETQFSLGALMNATMDGAAAAALLDETAYGRALTKNAWLDSLEARGYAVRVYQSAWVDFCRASTSVDTCYTYPLYSPNAMQRSSLTTGQRLRVLLGKLFSPNTMPQLSPLASTEALARFEADLERAPRGVAYVVHLLLPHYGYFYRENCALADPADWDGLNVDAPDALNTPREREARYRLYFAQLACTETRIAKLVDQLKRLGVYDEATIIVHGDHGSRIGERKFREIAAEQLTDRDLLDHYSSLFALKMPGITAGRREGPTLIQEAFANIFLSREPKRNDVPPSVLVRLKDGDFAPRDMHWPMAVAERR